LVCVCARLGKEILAAKRERQSKRSFIGKRGVLKCEQAYHFHLGNKFQIDEDEK
jgi:hypothetical protein